MNIKYTRKFLRMFNGLSKDVKRKALKKEALFKKNSFSPALKTHKLQGSFAGYYSFSITYSYRIVFRFLDGKKEVLFLLVGEHSIYR